MKVRARIAASLCALLGAAVGASAQDQSQEARPYWDAAVAVVSEGNKYLPARMETLFEELDGGGAVVSSERAMIALSYPGGDRKPDEQVLYAEKNGKDITEERKRNPARSQGPTDDGSSATPLDPEYQAGVQLLSLNRLTLNGRLVVEIAFEQPAGKQVYRGVVRIDAETKLPLSAVYSFKKMPIFVDDMETRLTYRVVTPPAAKARPGVIVDEVRFSAVATIFIVKKRVRGELRFMDHVKKS